MIGFKDKQVATALRDFVVSGKIHEYLGSHSEYLGHGRHYNKIYIATAETTITAAVGGTAGTDFEVGHGTAYLLDLDTSTNFLLSHENQAGSWKTVTVYNFTEEAITPNLSFVFPVMKDRLGAYWVIRGEIASPWYIGKVKTSAIASSTTGTVERHEYDWSPTGVTYQVYNPHDIELPVDWKVRWTKYLGWTGCGDPETDWIVEPWQFTECPPDSE